MTWTKEKVRQLRLRMGWSQSDLARRLNVELLIVSEIENGTRSIEMQHESFLSLIWQHADSASEEMALNPMAEQVLAEEDLPQIDRSDLIEKIQH